MGPDQWDLVLDGLHAIKERIDCLSSKHLGQAEEGLSVKRLMPALDLPLLDSVGEVG